MNIKILKPKDLFEITVSAKIITYFIIIFIGYVMLSEGYFKTNSIEYSVIWIANLNYFYEESTVLAITKQMLSLYWLPPLKWG